MSNSNQGSQFSCQNCGKSFFTTNGYEPHSHGEPIEIDPRQVENISNQGKTYAELANIERTRKVDLGDHADLLDHMSSDNGHGMGKYANWRGSYDMEGIDQVAGVRNYPDSRGLDFEMGHDELRKMHEKLHEVYPEEHLTNGDEHYHL